MEVRHEAWQAQLPEEPSHLWTALAALNPADRASLFAHCVGRTVNAVRDPHHKRPGALRHAGQLAAALALDLRAAGWTTTAGNYLARVTKAQILEAVREGKGDALPHRECYRRSPVMTGAALANRIAGVHGGEHQHGRTARGGVGGGGALPVGGAT